MPVQLSLIIWFLLVSLSAAFSVLPNFRLHANVVDNYSITFFSPNRCDVNPFRVSQSIYNYHHRTTQIASQINSMDEIFNDFLTKKDAKTSNTLQNGKNNESSALLDMIESNVLTPTQIGLGENETFSSNTFATDSSSKPTAKISAKSGQKKPVSSSYNKLQKQTEWTVYVCQSKPCLERGAAATLGAFVGLSPPNAVTVYPAILSKSKGKGPNIRCIYKSQHGHSDEISFKAFEVNNVDSVEKVYRILTKHMNVKGVNPAACYCLKWNYRGNAHLDKGEISLAIEAYDRAIAANYKDQEGVILVMRATAYLQRAFNHRQKLKQEVKELTKMVPETDKLGQLYQLLIENPILAKSIFQKKVIVDSKIQDKKFLQTKYYHGLYEYALLHATQDSLRATQLLPNYAKTWLRAGDSLAELRKLKESAQYYEKALELDPSLSNTLRPIIERLKKSQEFLDKARANGWTEDTLRVALAVTG